MFDIAIQPASTQAVRGEPASQPPAKNKASWAASHAPVFLSGVSARDSRSAAVGMTSRIKRRPRILRRFALSLLGATALPACVTPSLAQDKPVMLDEITVTAPPAAARQPKGFQGTPDWVYETPASVSVISREKLEQKRAA